MSKSNRIALERIAREQAAEDAGVGVPLRDARAKVSISVRLEPRVLAWLKGQGPGHLTRINEILVERMLAERKSA